MTSYDAAVYRETLRKENNSKAEWIKQHGSDKKVFAPDSSQAFKLRSLKDHVADLCDLQPTPVSLVRPPKKEMLQLLRHDLVGALADIESEIEAIGGSVSQRSSKAGGDDAASVRSDASKGSKASNASRVSKASNASRVSIASKVSNASKVSKASTAASKPAKAAAPAAGEIAAAPAAAPSES